MVIFETEYGNFGTPEDMLKYMEENKIEKIHVTCKFIFSTVTKVTMNIEDVKRWIEASTED